MTIEQQQERIEKRALVLIARRRVFLAHKAFKAARRDHDKSEDLFRAWVMEKAVLAAAEARASRA